MPERETVALVLAGGGARGAYEMGALSVLLPALEQAGKSPRLVVGTSIGALNAAFVASAIHRPTADLVAEGERIWREVRYGQVLRGLGSVRGLGRLGAYIGEVAGLPVRTTSLLDPAPLERTIPALIRFERLQANVAKGLVDAAVVATSASSSRSVVFHSGGRSPPRDDKRGIDYVRASPAAEHVRASAAIPVLFPAVRVETPARARGWYFDGGTRLNTPIKPAIALGADRVVVVGLNSIAGRGRRAHDLQPDLAEGASQLVQAVLVDPLVNDIQTLATENRMVTDALADGATVEGRRPIPYVFVAPKTVDAIGSLAGKVFERHFAGARGLLRSPDMAVLGRLMGGGRDAVHGELLSYVFFQAEFTRELLELGRQDARRWVDGLHDDGLWRISSRPPA